MTDDDRARVQAIQGRLQQSSDCEGHSDRLNCRCGSCQFEAYSREDLAELLALVARLTEAHAQLQTENKRLKEENAGGEIAYHEQGQELLHFIRKSETAEATVQQLQTERDTFLAQYEGWQKVAQERYEKMERAAATVQSLQEALKAIVDACEKDCETPDTADFLPDDCTVGSGDTGDLALTFGMIRLGRKALASAPSPGGMEQS